jgi:hypothetical protein
MPFPLNVRETTLCDGDFDVGGKPVVLIQSMLIDKSIRIFSWRFDTLDEIWFAF